MNKHLRYAIGIPLFSIGVGLLIYENPLPVSMWEAWFDLIISIELMYLGLWCLDVPTTTEININLK